MAVKLTTKLIRATAAPEKGAATLWDTEVDGFGIRLFAPSRTSPAGARSFFLNYRARGVERRITIGSLGVWSVEAARDRARELRRTVDAGADPAAERREERDAPAVLDLAERYRREVLPTKSERSQADDWRMIEKEILPRIGTRKVVDVHLGDVEAIHRAITERGAPVRANRVASCTSRMFSLALKPLAGETKPWRSQSEGNPCRGLEYNPEEQCERFYSAAELAAIGDALEAYPTKPPTDAIRLIMFTGCRPSEAVEATWEQFDRVPGFWIKRSAHTKQRKVHRAPLSPPAAELVARLRREREKLAKAGAARSPYLFPGRKPGEPLAQLHRLWDFVRDRGSVLLWRESETPEIKKIIADLERGFRRLPTVAECEMEAMRRNVELPTALRDGRRYDLRHTYASIGAGGGLSLPIIGRLLGHTQQRTTQRYAHLADDPLKEAAHRIGTVLSGAGNRGAEVVALKKAHP